MTSFIRKSARCLVAVVVATASLIASSRPASAGVAVSGGGASFPQLELDQWQSATAGKPYSLNILYVPSGSGFGRTSYLSGSLDFGVSDIPFQPEEQSLVNGSARKNFVYVPVSAGGLGFMYNLTDTNGARITNLQLTAHGVCRLLTEPSIPWNDPEIAASNPGIALPSNDAVPFVRSDNSGTSFVLSEFCIARAPDVWKKFVTDRVASDGSLAGVPFGQGKPTSSWPLGYGHVSGQFASDGVSDAVASSSGGANGIGYVETGFAITKGFPVASVQNAAGKFVQPTAHAVSVALGYARPVADGTYTLDYSGSDPTAYFPSSYSYVIAQKDGPADKGLVLAKFLCYAVTKGQEVAESLGYARLSSILVNGALGKILMINGAPPTAQCAVSSTPPPPPPPAATTTRPGSVATSSVGGSGSDSGSGSGSGSGSQTVITDASGSTIVVSNSIHSSGSSGAIGTAVEALPAGTPAGVANLIVQSVKARRAAQDQPAAPEVIWWLALGAGLFAAGHAVARSRFVKGSS